MMIQHRSVFAMMLCWLLLLSGAAAWAPAAGGFPPVAVYGLRINAGARVLYAATHGRGAWKLDLSR